MKQKVFETKKGVALYVDLEKVEYSTTDIDAVKTALNEDLNSSKPLDRSAAEMVLSIIYTMRHCFSIN